MKRKAFSSWLADQWFSQALIDADAATVVSGARPVKALKEDNGNVRIIWEELQPDMSVKEVGTVVLCLQDGDSENVLSCMRMSESVLPGEAQLMEKLLEAVNKNVYKKGLCTPVK